MTFSEAMTYIQGYQKSGKPVHDLSRIQALLEALGNPQEQLQVVHIAGTNGKGSVTAFCAGAATAAGFRTGTLTCAMTLAMVYVLPEPVTPSKVCSWSPSRIPCTSLAIASGWSPVGENGACKSK